MRRLAVYAHVRGRVEGEGGKERKESDDEGVKCSSSVWNFLKCYFRT
jgi:hypothetical protein